MKIQSTELGLQQSRHLNQLEKNYNVSLFMLYVEINSVFLKKKLLIVKELANIKFINQSS